MGRLNKRPVESVFTVRKTLASSLTGEIHAKSAPSGCALDVESWVLMAAGSALSVLKSREFPAFLCKIHM